MGNITSLVQLPQDAPPDVPQAALQGAPHGARDDGLWDEATARSIIAAHSQRPGATLPILHALQAAFGYVPRQSHAIIADALNLSRAEIYGVVSFYHDFRAAPPGRHVLKICRAEACQAMGAAALAEDALRAAGAAWGGTAADGSITIEPTYCLGLCACAPAALLDGEPVGRLTAAGLDAIVTRCREHAA
jgi:formate dehydrogenase subunit gamma